MFAVQNILAKIVFLLLNFQIYREFNFRIYRDDTINPRMISQILILRVSSTKKQNHAHFIIARVLLGKICIMKITIDVVPKHIEILNNEPSL